ncbi:hypothetical protein [Frondihabitans sucicola]|uniref:hypothetical protein n=1 Tax=Frondihabitans sucicola TaxID=1268041 RepID=UPI002573F98E|nr:hypothetical protein [Frondihabitans sucicola]
MFGSTPDGLPLRGDGGAVGRETLSGLGGRVESRARATPRGAALGCGGGCWEAGSGAGPPAGAADVSLRPGTSAPAVAERETADAAGRG